MGAGEIVIVVAASIAASAGLCWVIYASAVRISRNEHGTRREHRGGR